MMGTGSTDGYGLMLDVQKQWLAWSFLKILSQYETSVLLGCDVVSLHDWFHMFWDDYAVLQLQTPIIQWHGITSQEIRDLKGTTAKA